MKARTYDAIIAGASFAGLAVARELRGRVLLLDRHEVGEHQTSACGTTVRGLHDGGVETDAGRFEAPVIVDASGWHRALVGGLSPTARPARLSFGLETEAGYAGDDLYFWVVAALTLVELGYRDAYGERSGLRSPRQAVDAATACRGPAPILPP